MSTGIAPVIPQSVVPNLRKFVRFTGDGEIYQDGIQEDHYTQKEIDDGAYIAFGDAVYLNLYQTYRNYVVFLSEGKVEVRPRPMIDWDFDRTELKVGEEATLKDAPAASLEFIGPVMGTSRHEGGDLLVGFTLPGDYVIKLKPDFPYLPATLFLTVGV